MHITVKISWRKQPDESFIKGRYSRVHRWVFDGGMEIDASSSPEIVQVPFSDPALIDPEEAFVAALSSCHMLFFLSLAAKEKIEVLCYEDRSEATMKHDAQGNSFVSALVLKPDISFGEPVPDIQTVRMLHEMAHAKCFLANSVITKITVN